MNNAKVDSCTYYYYYFIENIYLVDIDSGNVPDAIGKNCLLFAWVLFFFLLCSDNIFFLLLLFAQRNFVVRTFSLLTQERKEK